MTPNIKNNAPILFILKAVNDALLGINTSNMATITNVKEYSVDVMIDTTKEELFDLPIFTLQGGGSYIQFPISVNDKCMVVFSKDSADNWQTGTNQPAYSSNFDINNGFAFVGINDDTNPIEIQDYTNLVVEKIKIQNETAELISTLSDITSKLVDTIAGIESLTVTTGSNVSTVPNNVATFTTIKGQITTLKSDLDSFKV